MNPLARVDCAHTAEQYTALAAHYQDWSSIPWRDVVALQGKYIDDILQNNGLQTPCRVLDLTCGKGTQLFGLAERGHACTGIDLSDGQIQAARDFAPSFTNGANIQWICGDALQAKKLLQDAPSFDAVISFGNSLPLLGSLDNIHACLKGASSILRSGGLLILTGMDYTTHRNTHPHIMQHGPIKGTREGGWMETAEWMDNGEQYVSYVTFLYTRPEHGIKHYPFTLLHALTGEELRLTLEQAGFCDILIQPRTDIKMENFYLCTARKA